MQNFLFNHWFDLGFFIYPALQLLALILIRKRWRIAAALPLLVMGPVLIFTIIGYIGASNLWPVLLIITVPYAIIYLILLFIAYAIYLYRLKNKAR